MATEAEAVIEVRDLSKRFRDVLAVDRLSLSVRKGEIFGFLGPNGAGKTTTIKMLMGLTRASSGEAFLLGRKADADAVESRRSVGYLPERVAFYDNLTAVQTMHFLCDLKGADRASAMPLLEEVGLSETAGRKVGTFSKGMTQLLGVAQAMIGDPSVYILDEPSSGLDPRWVKSVRDRMKALNEKGATILFSSHILGEVQSLCHRVAIIDRGRLIADDTVAGLNERLKIRPRLVLTVAGLGGKVPEEVRRIGGILGAEADGDRLTVTCEGSLRADVVTVLTGAGYKVTDLRTVEPSLEDAFVRLVSGDKGAS